MINDKALIVINRCQSTLCRHVLAYIPGDSQPIIVTETGSDTCEHAFDPSMAVSMRRDVLILHGIWTVGRVSVDTGMDARAHVLAETLGYRAGDAIPVTEIPLQLVSVAERELTWQGVCVAARVAARIAAKSPNAGWSRISEYLARWQHHVM